MHWGGKGSSAMSAFPTQVANMARVSSPGSVTVKKAGQGSFVAKVCIGRHFWFQVISY